jgi:NTP pyrophosphatase (non-canonical NTP hydrolase)
VRATGRLTVLLTSPRLPPGLLTRDAWLALERADLVVGTDRSAPLASALIAGGMEVGECARVSASSLVDLAAGRGVVWLAGDGGEPSLTAELAAHVVRRAEGSASPDEPEVEVEVMVGSFDPVGARLLDAVTVMDTLRRECPWDREQTHQSLVPYLVEEAYEVVEAIETSTGDDAARDQLREELGDLLLQVLFHARLAAEHPYQPFTIDDVAAGLVDKLVRRHPHVFGETQVAGAADVAANWDEIKRTEKGRASAVDGIPAGLPALSLADSVIGRVLRSNAPLSVPVPEGGTAYTEETLGDVLFALVAAARASGLDAEQALRARVRREIAAVRAASAPDF